MRRHLDMEPSDTSQVLGFVLILFVIVVIACAVLFLAALCRAAGRTRPRPPIAAPAPDPDPRVPVRALEACMVLGCPNPWTVARHGWKVCDTHDHARPYDQEAIDVVADEAEQWLREHSGGAA